MPTKLLPYQAEGVRKMKIFKGRALLADSMGLGKTIQALDYACQGDYFPAIVVCPSIAKLEWEEQAWRHRKVSSTICSTRKPPHPQLFETEDLVIINYDILKYWVELLACLKPKLIILDEVHNIANDNSQRTEAVRLLCSGVKRVLALSGTPLVNRPFELWPTLNIIRPDEFKSQFSFGHKWCDPEFTFGRWEFKGCTDPVALNKLLLKTCMIRRTKEEVLDQLPPKRHHVLSLEIKKRKEYEKAEANLISWLAGYDMAAAHRAMRNERFTRFSYLKHLAAQLKLDSVVEWVKEFLLESDGKLLIGTMHRDVLSSLENRVKALTRVVTIQGGKTDKQRKEAEKIFRTHKDCRILIGNMKACGVALNLPEAKAVLLAEFPFAPGTVQQFIDRAHRLTTTHEVDVYYGVGTGTIENLLCRILDRKMRILNQVLDGVEERDGSLPVLEELHNQILKEKGKNRGKASKDF
jgi:SWI/SNF-related matrix-associated actin-dependent regulator 1 of chromatin subfamily A